MFVEMIKAEDNGGNPAVCIEKDETTVWVEANEDGVFIEITENDTVNSASIQFTEAELQKLMVTAMTLQATR
jgi:hypothetical protein